MIDCHTCGQPGHVARDCQWEPEAKGRMPWCGNCDKRTRLIDHGTYFQRCHQCWAWPAKGTRFHQLLPQHRLCGGCKNLVYAWEGSPCGQHQSLALDPAGRRLHREPVAAQAAIAARARQAITKRGTHD